MKILWWLLVSFLLTTPIYALSDSEAIPCIVGEASGTSYEEMTAIAEALRNRNSTKGVYGCTASHNKLETKSTYTMAQLAWESSKNTNYVKGANHWESTNFKKTPYWTKKMTQTAHIGTTKFYKPRQEGD